MTIDGKSMRMACEWLEDLKRLAPGRAWVQIDGITVHDLFEGESYGDASVLGLTQKANWNVKAASGSMCLYLYAKKELVQKVCKQSEGVELISTPRLGGV